MIPWNNSVEQSIHIVGHFVLSVEREKESYVYVTWFAIRGHFCQKIVIWFMKKITVKTPEKTVLYTYMQLPWTVVHI